MRLSIVLTGAVIILEWKGGQAAAWIWRLKGRKSKGQVVFGLEGLIGNTPLVQIESLSNATGCQILAKAEFLNPGGSVKDRVALQIFKEGMGSGALKPGGLITEGTVGSTGVSLALMAASAGCDCFIAMPDDAASEKVQMLQALGAEVCRKRPVAISHPDHFVNVARREARAHHSALFADQFENLANFRAHLKTGEEIRAQCGKRIDAFVCGSGTGGTIAGVSNRLKELDSSTRVYLVDPPGSGLYNKVKRGVMFVREEAEQKRLKNPFDTITEGVGINRITQNFAQLPFSPTLNGSNGLSMARIDDAFKCSDREAVEMAAYLLRNDGLFIGSSAAVNCVGAVKAARRHSPGSVIVTLLCDGGQRHLSKFHNQAYLRKAGLAPVATGLELNFVAEDEP